MDTGQLKHTLALRLALCLEVKNISQAELSDTTGISQASISRYLNEARLPRLTELVMMSLIIGVSVDWLLGLDEINALPGEIVHV